MSTNSFASVLIYRDSQTATKTCASDYPKYVLKGDLRNRPFAKYNVKFTSESSAKSDMERNLKREGYSTFKYKSWRDAYADAWDDYEEVYHKSAECKVKGSKNWENCESLYKVTTCEDRSSGDAIIKVLYGWG